MYGNMINILRNEFSESSSNPDRAVCILFSVNTPLVGWLGFMVYQPMYVI